MIFMLFAVYVRRPDLLALDDSIAHETCQLAEVVVLCYRRLDLLYQAQLQGAFRAGCHDR